MRLGQNWVIPGSGGATFGARRYTISQNMAAHSKDLGRDPSALGRGSRSSMYEALTICALGGGVEEEQGLVDDTTACASSADETAHNTSGATRHEGHDSVGSSAASLKEDSRQDHHDHGCWEALVNDTDQHGCNTCKQTQLVNKVLQNSGGLRQCPQDPETSTAVSHTQEVTRSKPPLRPDACSRSLTHSHGGDRMRPRAILKTRGASSRCTRGGHAFQETTCSMR